MREMSGLAELRRHGRMTWMEPQRGWVAAPEEILTALAKDGFEECKRALTSSRSDSRPAGGVWQGVVAKLVELSEKVLYADVWERSGLSKRDRSLITVAALTALYRSDQLKGHLERALANGVTREEISEVITHMAFYAGWPTAMTA